MVEILISWILNVIHNVGFENLPIVIWVSSRGVDKIGISERKTMAKFYLHISEKIKNFRFVDKTNYKINTYKPEITNTSLIYVRPGLNKTAPNFFFEILFGCF